MSRRAAARTQLRWGLLFLAGLLLPLLAGFVLFDQSRVVRLGAVFAVLAAVDVPLVIAGASGRGAPGIVQPWKWWQYAFWLGVRLAILLPLALVSPASS